MPKAKTKTKIETNTARRSKPSTPLKKHPSIEEKVSELLEKLYSMATTEGNTTAAKLYLDYVLKQKGEDTDVLTPEEALRILQGQRSKAAI